MEFRELNYLITIAEERSISKAAEKLFMAQSSLSQSLQSMEAELGGKLFIRTSTGVPPRPGRSCWSGPGKCWWITGRCGILYRTWRS